MATIICESGGVYDGRGQVIEGESVAFQINAGVSNVTIKNYVFKNCKYAVRGAQSFDNSAIYYGAESHNIVVEDNEFCNDYHNDFVAAAFFQPAVPAYQPVPGSRTGEGWLIDGNGIMHNVQVTNNRCIGAANIATTGVADSSGTGVAEYRVVPGDGGTLVAPDSDGTGNGISGPAGRLDWFRSRAWDVSMNSSDGSIGTPISLTGLMHRVTGNHIKNSGNEAISVNPMQKSIKKEYPSLTLSVNHWDVAQGAHLIANNNIQEYGIKRDSAEGAIVIRQPMTRVENNVVKVTSRGIQDSDVFKIAYFYSNMAPFLWSYENVARMGGDSATSFFRPYTMQAGVVPSNYPDDSPGGTQYSTIWPVTKMIAADDSATYFGWSLLERNDRLLDSDYVVSILNTPLTKY
jgi:hypothetical protein